MAIQRIPESSSGREVRLSRPKPVFSFLAFLIALAVGAATFAFQFKRDWSPLEQYYFPAYFRTAHLTTSRNPYLQPAHTFEVLMIAFHRGMTLARDGDVIPVPSLSPGARSQVNFELSSAARKDRAFALSWQVYRFNDRWFHAWLEHWIYRNKSLWQLLRPSWYAALLVLALLLPSAIRKDIDNGRERHRIRPLKGANLIDRTEFHRRYHHHAGVGFLTLGSPSSWECVWLPKAERRMVRFPRRHEWEHFLLVGVTGSGKSSLIRQLLIQIAQRDETAIVYDPHREYLPQFLEPGRGDTILNPIDARMPEWSPSDELLHYSEADAMAKCFFPDRDREWRFFTESPRDIFAHLLKYRPTPQEICRWIAHAYPEIDKRVADTELEPLVSKDAPQQRTGVLSGLARIAKAFKLLPVIEDRERAWTITRWTEQRQGWIFLSYTTMTREALRPLLSMWLDLLLLRLTSQTDYGQRPVWLILDEVASLETLPTLPFALSESRKANIRIVLGMQGKSQVEARYGQEAETMLSQPRTKIFLRTTEPRAAEWVSKSIGDREIEHLREGWSRRQLALGQTDNATIERRIEAAVLASEVANLEDLEGYIQGPGYTLKLRFPLFHPEINQPAEILREPPSSSWASRGKSPKKPAARAVPLAREPIECDSQLSLPGDWQQTESEGGDTLAVS
jgi:Type IV secretion-system coupling protein DNA-binding domain